MAENTWSGLTPENDKIWDELFDKYVPVCGTAETVGGEILRAMSRIIYRFYNDGDMVGIGYGNETCNSSNRYLCDVVPEYQTLDGIMFEDKYEEAMKKNHRIVFNYLKSNKELFEKKNTEDSRIASEEDYRRGREDSEDDWYDNEEY